jgi:membrane protein implicated in regulation of membrane protease activity
VKVFWMILAGGCSVVAAVFVFRGDYDNAFIAAAAGAVCSILNYRQQLRTRVRSREELTQGDEEVDEEDRS